MVKRLKARKYYNYMRRGVTSIKTSDKNHSLIEKISSKNKSNRKAEAMCEKEITSHSR